MNASDLKAALRKLDWPRAELARKIGVNPNTASAWTTGKRPVPYYVVAYLDVVFDLREIAIFCAPTLHRRRQV